MMELLSLRQENGKTFAVNGGGKRQLVVSIGAIHYKDNYANKFEQWKDIDLTWEGNCIKKAPYELTLEGNKATIRDKKSGEVSTIELLESKPAGLKYEVLPEFSAVRFRHTLPTDRVPFEARFKVTGKIPFKTRASNDEDGLPLEVTFKDGILTEKLSSLPGLTRGAIKVDPTWTVSGSTDDCRYRKSLDAWDLTHATFLAGSAYLGNDLYGNGARFQNVTIPAGAIIATAYMTLHCRASGSGAGVKTYFSAEKVDDAPTFADDKAAFLARYANNTATVAWDFSTAWTANSNYDSGDFAAVIQTTIDRDGWNSGQDIVLFWEDFDGRSDEGGFRNAESYDGDSSNPPKLVATYIIQTPVTDGDLIGIGVVRKT